MFNNLINHLLLSNNDNISINVFPISTNNIKAIKILINNCIKNGVSYSNAEIVSVSPSIWLSDFLENNLKHINYVTDTPRFDWSRLDINNDILTKTYNVGTIEFSNEQDMNDYFSTKSWNNLVIYSIVRLADLRNMTYKYTIRLADVTEEYEIRDKKLNEILN